MTGTASPCGAEVGCRGVCVHDGGGMADRGPDEVAEEKIGGPG